MYRCGEETQNDIILCNTLACLMSNGVVHNGVVIHKILFGCYLWNEAEWCYVPFNIVMIITIIINSKTSFTSNSHSYDQFFHNP